MTSATISSSQCRSGAAVSHLREMAIQALRRMYLPDDRAFCFCIRRVNGDDVVEGISRRYTATTLIGLATESEATIERILSNAGVHEVCDALLADLDDMKDLGEVALALWAARSLNHPGADLALRRLQGMAPHERSYPTVEVAWCLTAMSVPGDAATDHALAEKIANRLLASFRPQSELFPHWPHNADTPWLRAHVTCFADWVYPVQALSHYHHATGNAEAIDTARRAARRMRGLQGPDGQWWWHYDVRTGRVVEGYPVYSVHQDSMAPMALLALQAACGEDSDAAIAKGLGWLASSPELNDESLLDTDAGIIWRKVARKEPAKLSRRLQALASRTHPALRVPLLAQAIRPTRVDFESRPYHMGWILHAWPEQLCTEGPWA